MQTVHTLPHAKAEVAVRLTAVLCIKGGLSALDPALSSWWRWWRATIPGQTLVCWRDGASSAWRPLVAHGVEQELLGMWTPASSPGAPRSIQWADRAYDHGELLGHSVTWLDLPAVLGQERVSMICLRLPEGTSAALLTQLGEVSMQTLPLWWGTAGYALDYVSGRSDVAAQQMAALARRYWCAQLLDLTSLQWDALQGLPGVNWLTWLSASFVEHRGLTLDDLVQALGAASGERVFHRRSANGLSVAAGAEPVKGDINQSEPLASYARIAHIMKGLVLETMTPLAGPLARPKVLKAWLNRFEAPQVWLQADISHE
jgi:hypothetical protein